MCVADFCSWSHDVCSGGRIDSRDVGRKALKLVNNCLFSWVCDDDDPGCDIGMMSQRVSPVTLEEGVGECFLK